MPEVLGGGSLGSCQNGQGKRKDWPGRENSKVKGTEACLGRRRHSLGGSIELLGGGNQGLAGVKPGGRGLSSHAGELRQEDPGGPLTGWAPRSPEF